MVRLLGEVSRKNEVSVPRNLQKRLGCELDVVFRRYPLSSWGLAGSFLCVSRVLCLRDAVSCILVKDNAY